MFHAVYIIGDCFHNETTKKRIMLKHLSSKTRPPNAVQVNSIYGNLYQLNL